MQVESLKIKLQQMEEDLTRVQNQERVAKEKSSHLEQDLRKAEQKLSEAEQDGEATGAREQEFYDERKQLIIDIQDRQNEALKYSQENVVLNKEVEKLSKKVKDQETVLA